MAHDHEHEHESWRAAALLAGLTLIFGLAAWLVEPWQAGTAFALFLAAYMAGLWGPARDSAHELLHGNLDIDFLMVLVAVGAWMLGHPEEGAALLVLFNAGHAMEQYARERTHSALGALVGELPDSVLLVDGMSHRSVPVAEVQPGDQLLLRAGDRLPVDATLVEGSTTFDFSAITGESAPVVPNVGDEIPSGALNREGAVTLRALRPPTESAYQKIIRLVEEAPARRSPAQQLSESVGRWFTIVILAASLGGFLMWWLAAGLPIREAAYRAMVLLVAGSPCAIVLSIPSAILAAIASGARRGLLFNGGIGLSALARVRHIAFDKTGTLSTGEPGVVKVLWDAAPEGPELGIAYALAAVSTHPASRAVRCHALAVAPNLQHNHPDVEEIREVPGRGMQGIVNGRRWELGRDSTPPGPEEREGRLGRVALYCDGKRYARFLLSENARPGAAEMAHQLRAAGLSPLVLSGDTQPAVDRLAQEIGIGDAQGELSPQAKWEVIRRLADDGGVAMVGDGINDVPALAAATVGVAMGIRGSAAALAQADVVLVKDRLPDLVEAVHLSRRTQSVVRQNLTIAIGAAALMVIVASFGQLPLALGVFGHEGGTVLVVLNSLRLLQQQAPAGTPLSPVTQTATA